MEAVTYGAIAKEVASYGVLGLGWLFSLYLIWDRRFERKKYSELVVHIITYFTKINMVERNSDALGIPPGLYGGDETPGRIASFFGRDTSPPNNGEAPLHSGRRGVSRAEGGREDR